MIKVNSISIKEFRGIRDLTLDFNGRNYAICGPNGTGKSGIVDALEFALSGDISRLSGKGRGDVSVKEHAPHVDFRDNPEKAVVTLKGTLLASGKQFKITRNVKDARKPKIEPETPDVLEALAEVGAHKDNVLSRRELIQYVIATPGDRSTEIQALLRLHQMQALRASLQKISNACARDAKLAERDCMIAARNLATALNIPRLTPPKLLEAVNAQRAILGLPEITALDANTSIKDGLTVAAEKSTTVVAKKVASADVESLAKKIEEQKQKLLIDEVSSIITQLTELSKNKDFVVGVEKEQLLQSALSLVDEDGCPVCDTEWNEEELIQHIKTKISELNAVIKHRVVLEKTLEPIIIQIQELESSLIICAEYGEKLKPEVITNELSEYASKLKGIREKILTFIPLIETVTSLKATCSVPETVGIALNQLSKSINALPDATKKDAARDYLVACQVRLEVYRQHLRDEKTKKEDAKITETIFDTYEKTSTEALNDIYDTVEGEFADLYRTINSDDEGEFEAKLQPVKAGLGFDVDFYGRGKFPPGAYHSEGHQDGMGLCLYLALMHYLRGDDFKFCVLDDVLMSVDSAHRREVCALLKKRFPETQFILTTHDEVWLRNLETVGLVGKQDSVRFRNWDIEQGPSDWAGKDIWAEIDTHLTNNDVKSAAGNLRHYLEYFSGEVCHNLGAMVVYRGDAQHVLGDLLPQAIGQYGKLLKQGKSAANSWGQQALVDGLSSKAEGFSIAVTATSVEQWQINVAIHYNKWAQLNKEDFLPVVEAFKTLLPHFECESCGGLLYVSPSFGKKESLRCTCSKININLKSK